jgi:hypothetical protein
MTPDATETLGLRRLLLLREERVEHRLLDVGLHRAACWIDEGVGLPVDSASNFNGRALSRTTPTSPSRNPTGRSAWNSDVSFHFGAPDALKLNRYRILEPYGPLRA